MSNLENFFSLPDVDGLTCDFEPSERLGTITVKAMSRPEYKSYQKQASYSKGQKLPEMDFDKFELLVVANNVIEPCFSSAEFLRKAGGYNTPNEFINAKLFPGEVAEIASKIIEISGFGKSIKEALEEAKN